MVVLLNENIHETASRPHRKEKKGGKKREEKRKRKIC